jgi:NaMN:DMB phosphoribosyltransferase
VRFVLKLKENPLRKALRYGLWLLIIGIVIVTAINIGSAIYKQQSKELLREAELATGRLIESPARAAESYKTLAEASKRYPKRDNLKVGLALAHYRMGNNTEALAMLPKTLNTTQEKLIGAMIEAKAGEHERVAELIKDIEPEKLSAAEKRIYDDARSAVEANAPLKQWIDLLKNK